jgi:hypothetical protein
MQLTQPGTLLRPRHGGSAVVTDSLVCALELSGKYLHQNTRQLELTLHAVYGMSLQMLEVGAACGILGVCNIL